MVLNLNSIRKSYRTNEGNVSVLNDVSLTLLAGETLALRGESGSGKSTLLHIAGALELPDTGSVEIDGKELSKMDDTGRAAVRRKDIAIIFQHFNLIPSLNVAANINFQANLSGPVDKIKLEKIRVVMGPGGKMIREICEATGAKVDIEDDGTIKIAASDTEAAEAAQKRINDIVAEAELGVIYTGKVVKTVDFGAFVNFLGTKDGLVHISELQDARTEKTTDICKEGDMVKVKVIGFDDRGKVKLSMKRVNQKTGEDIESKKDE